MPGERLDAIEDRLLQLERRIELIDYRVRSIEMWRNGEPVSAPPEHTVQEAPPPPPRFQPPTPPPVIAAPAPERSWEPFQRLNALQAPAEPSAQSDRDTEYFIGAKVLPWVGAFGVLGAIIYFVAWGY